MATQTTGGGSTTSFTNTPQAKDDSYNYIEDLLRANSTLYNSATNTLYLDVMSNDLGGGAKTLFAVSDGDGNAITSDFELLCKDVDAAGISPWEETLNHNWVRINNGKIEYRIADGSGIPGQGRSVDSLTDAQNFSDEFVYSIRLGNGTLSEAVVTINITGAQDMASIAVAGSADTDVTEAGGVANALPGDPSAGGTLVASDADLGENKFQAPPSASLTGHYGSFTFDPNSGVWTYTLDNNLAATQALPEGQAVTETLTVQSYDGSASYTITVTVHGTNDAPVAVADSAAITENQAVTVDVLANDTDVDAGHSFTLVSAAAPSGKGNASVVGNQLQFDPGTDFDHLAQGATETVTVSYTMQDEHGATSTSTLTITVTGTNDGPVANGDSAAGTENQILLVDVLANDTDVDDGHVLTLTGASAPSGKGTASVVGNQLQFSPGTDFDHLAQGASETVTISYTMQDEHGATSTSTLTVTVTGTNDTPVAQAASNSLFEDASVTGNVGATDADDGAVLSYALTGAPPAGLTFHSDGSYTFDASSYDGLAAGEPLVLVIPFTATDELGATSAPADLTITITGTNDAPVVNDVAVTTAVEDGPAVGGSFSGDDVDSDDSGSSLTYTISSSPGEGSVANNHDGTFSFDPGDDFQDLAAGETRQVSFTYTATDVHGAVSNTGTVTVTVTGTNDDPVISIVGADSASAALDESDAGLTASGTLTVNDADTSNLVDTQVSSVVLGGTTGGLVPADVVDMLKLSGDEDLQANTGDAHNLGWTFDSDSQAFDFLADGEQLTLTYTLTSTDDEGATDTQDVTITISGSNDGVVVTSGEQGESISEDGTSVGGAITFTDADLSDGHTASASADPDNDTALGTFAIDSSVTEAPNEANGSLAWTYTVDNDAAQYLAADESVVEKYDVTIDDGKGGQIVETVTVTITGANDGPDIRVEAGDSAGADRDEGNSGLTASGTLTVTDPDASDTVDTSAAIAVSGNQGALSDGDLLAMFSITAGETNLAADTGSSNNLGWSFDSGTEAFDFLAQGQTLTLTYTLTSDDGNGGTDTQDVTITITGTNDDPVLTASVTSGTYTDTSGDDSFTSLTGSLSTADPDSGDSATYSVGGGVPDLSHSGYDVSSSNAYGILYLNSLSGAYEFVPNETAIEGLKGDDSVSFTLTVTDGKGATDSETLTVSIDGTNDTPVLSATLTEATFTDTAGDDSFSAVTGDLASTDRDAGDTATYGVLGGSPDNSLAGYDTSKTTLYGTLYVDSATGNYTFVPDDGAIEGLKTDTTLFFTLQVTDGSNATVGQTLTINLNGANDTPEAPATGSVTTDEDMASAATAIGATDRDAGETLTYSVKAGDEPGKGSVSFDQTNGTFTYTPDADANGSDSFTILVTDAGGATAEQVVTVTINPVNDLPVAGDDTASTDEDTPLNITAATLLANDTDVDIATDGQVLTITGVTDGAHGSAVVNPDGSVSYTPDPNFNGTDTVTYTVSDGHGGTDTATITITVNAVNDAPVATGDSYMTNEDTALIISAPGVLVNDSDVDGDVLSSVLVSGPAHGTLTLNADGSFTYTPDLNFNGTDSFTYTPNDGSADGNTVTVNLTVDPVNDAPTSAGASNSTAEDMPLSGNLPGAADVDGDAVTYALGTNASNGNVVVNANGTFTYTPNANFNGPDSFTFTLSDGHGGSNTYNYDVTVTPVNDAPTSSPGSNSTAEDTALSATLPAATDVDGDSITYSLGANAANGNVVVNADGTFTYTPNANFNGSDGFTFTVSDGHGGSNTYSYGLTVTPVNDAPVGAGDSYSTAEDTALTIAAPGVLVNDSDVDGNALNSVLVTGPAHGSLTLNADGSFTYTPALNYNGPDSFTYTPNDGSTDGNTVTVNLNVTPVNDAPTSANGSNSTQEDTALSASLPAASDVDGNPVSYALDTNAAHGNVVINANGTFTYTPTADYNGSDSFKFTVSDGQGGSNTYTYSLNVTPVADAVNDTATTNAGTAVTTSVLANDNFEGSPVVTNASNGTNGTVTFNGTSTTYVPNAGFSGADSYSYTVTSGGVTETATVNVTVNPPANSLFLRINVPGPEGQDALNFANFTVTIGSTVYHLSDLIVVPGSVQYSAASTGFALGPGGTGGRTVVFEIPNAPTTGAVQIHFDYSSSNNGNTTNDGPVFSIGTTAAAGTQIANYSNTASPAWVGDVSTTSRTIAFDYTTSGATVNVSNIVDPIILDLGARGIALSNTVSFDMDADGHAQGVAWTNGEDGILAVDLNGDGRIDSGREILSPWFNGGGFAHSLDALASLDSTGDGVLDANDVAFGALRVWVDANSNGITDAGELLSLSDLGITAINLATIAGSGAIDGQNVLANGSFSYADRTTGNFAAVELTETVTTRVFNGQGTEDVIGTAGDDLLFAGGLGNAMSAEAGNDVLYSGAGNDRLSGGDGGDRFVLASSGADTITDYAPGDTIDITSVLNVAGDTDVIAGGYLRITTTGLVQVDSDGGGDNWVTIANVNLGPASYAIAYGSGDSVRTIEVAPVAPPIGVDMDGDGQVSFLGTDAGVTFDYGYGKVATAWVAGNDGILVRDANHDGQASADEVVFATTGSDLDGLAIYDSNHDGQLSAADAGFADFRVWQDGNGNGIVEAGEMTSLTALGIAGISLTSDRIGFSAAGGDVQVVGTGSYTRSDGSTGVLADAVFTTGARASDEQLRVTGALASNAGLVGAVAAAGLMAVPVHAEVRPVDGREVQPWAEQHLSLAPQPSASERVENNHALQGEAKVAPDVASTAMLSHSDLHPGWHASDPLSVSDSGQGAPHISELLGGTSAAAPAPQPPVAAAPLMVSAEMLQAAMAAVAHQGAGKADPRVADTGSEQVRGVLLDALASHSHGKPDVDSLLNAIAGAHQGHGGNGHGAIAPVLADAYGQVHFAMHAEPLAEMMALHAAAPLHG